MVRFFSEEPKVYRLLLLNSVTRAAGQTLNLFMSMSITITLLIAKLARNAPDFTHLESVSAPIFLVFTWVRLAKKLPTFWMVQRCFLLLGAHTKAIKSSLNLIMAYLSGLLAPF